MKYSDFYVLLMAFVATGVFIWLFGFGGYDSMLYGRNYIEERTSAWKNLVESQIPVGSTRPMIKDWAAKNSFAVYEAPDNRSVEIVVQTIPYHQVVCKEWKIIAEIVIEQDKSTSEHVVPMGACL